MEDKTQRNWRPQRDLDWKTNIRLTSHGYLIQNFLVEKREFCTKGGDALHSCCRASIPNVIVDGQDDSEEEEEEETAAATEQFSTDMAYVLPVKQPPEESSDTSDYG